MASTKAVAVVVGATSKWQAGGRNTLLVHGTEVDDSDLPLASRWGIGAGVALKFAAEGFFVVLTTRAAPNAAGLQKAIEAQGGECMTVELDIASEESVAAAFRLVRERIGDPTVVVESTRAVRRLRNHTSLALWCGNNENQWMVHLGAFGKGASVLGRRLYDEVLPAVVAAEDPETPSWPSSPWGSEPRTYDDLVYYGQLNQADAMRFGIEHFRRLRPHTMGTLAWQLNDCWPVQSWAWIDHALRPKAVWYAAKQFYATTAPQPVVRDCRRSHGAGFAGERRPRTSRRHARGASVRGRQSSGVVDRDRRRDRRGHQLPRLRGQRARWCRARARHLR